MENKEKNMKIRMEDVYEAIKKNGFYTTPMEKHYDENFVGPELIVVTDDPDFKVHHPELAEMNIMGTELFAEVAKDFNRYMHNNSAYNHKSCKEQYQNSKNNRLF